MKETSKVTVFVLVLVRMVQYVHVFAKTVNVSVKTVLANANVMKMVHVHALVNVKTVANVLVLAKMENVIATVIVMKKIVKMKIAVQHLQHL
ncbi:hypothetical protein [Flammeovirga agarivorans]|uniref:Uncharacterized protein n=1 Tax=Flammeovirga agarivorans TaxID=2726742 RepID=A0A7X8SQK5_9BACT|nr:hypothetical protein [Flammeovirga agarivorans]NLR94573.1 hypothetical protein [Flammeovirga agarivorans]